MPINQRRPRQQEHKEREFQREHDRVRRTEHIPNAIKPDALRHARKVLEQAFGKRIVRCRIGHNRKTHAIHNGKASKSASSILRLKANGKKRRLRRLDQLTALDVVKAKLCEIVFRSQQVPVKLCPEIL